MPFETILCGKHFSRANPTSIIKCVSVLRRSLRYCHKFGEVYATSPNLEGVAAWVPGHLSYMTLWKMIRSGAIFPGMRIGTDAGRKMSAVFSPLEYDRKANMKGNAFVYLFIIGVGNQWQGRGFGGMLLRGLIDRCDTAGDAIYLETEMARNVAFYERFGFNVIQQVLLPVVDHPMWQMVRKPGDDIKEGARLSGLLPTSRAWL